VRETKADPDNWFKKKSIRFSTAQPKGSSKRRMVGDVKWNSHLVVATHRQLKLLNPREALPQNRLIKLLQKQRVQSKSLPKKARLKRFCPES